MKRFFSESLIAVSVAAALALGTYNPALGLAGEPETSGLLQPLRAAKAPHAAQVDHPERAPRPWRRRAADPG